MKITGFFRILKSICIFKKITCEQGRRVRGAGRPSSRNPRPRPPCKDCTVAREPPSGLKDEIFLMSISQVGMYSFVNKLIVNDKLMT